MSHRKQHVTVGDLLAVRAMEMSSLVPSQSLPERIDAADRDGDDQICRCELRLVSDDELFALGGTMPEHEEPSHV